MWGPLEVTYYESVLADVSRNVTFYPNLNIWPIFSIFGVLPVIGGVYISKNTPSKSIIAVILRGQPSFYEQRFSRY